jgi:predicted RNase H-like HicB family nuclease
VDRRLRGTRYIALVDGSAGKYGVIVPDLPGCTSGGETLDEALHNAVEAVRLWEEDAIADGEALPPPRSLEDIRSDRKAVRAVAEGAPARLYNNRSRRGIGRARRMAGDGRAAVPRALSLLRCRMVMV